ncbi:hypothetical protein I544_5420 [Mycobacteroides abscessus subsp. bolletii 103]|nr:hypothetical protein I544_5420 [Mycobacteroides abscessus subsp. bolletii 103]
MPSFPQKKVRTKPGTVQLISGLVGLEVWARGFSPIEFEPDAPRLAAIDALRQHVAVRNEPNAILVYGAPALAAAPCLRGSRSRRRT